MKVFAPGRVISIITGITGTESNLCSGIPLDGDWMDVDDYFEQVTSGHAINDVVHAKVVASTGMSYSTLCGDLVDERGNHYLSSVYDSGRQHMYVMAAPFRTSDVWEWYYPKYKGKKKINPRRRKRHLRTTHGVLVDLMSSSSNGKPSMNLSMYFHCPLSDQISRNRYAYKQVQCRIYFSGNSASSYWKYTYPDNRLLALCEDICRIYESRWPNYKSRWTYDDLHEFNVEMNNLVYNAVQPHLFELAEYYATLKSSSRGAALLVTSCTTAKAEIPIEAGFMFGEKEINVAGLDPLMLRGDRSFQSYWRNYLMQHALLEALETFPKLNDNSISNALEVLSFIKALVVDHKIELPKSLSQMWLSYRYQYKTTELDAKEAIKFVRRQSNLGTLDQAIQCHGTSSHRMEDGTMVECRCTCTVVPQIVSTVNRLLRALDTYGLTPDFYVIWDMIPWSFMVDWFVPVGDILGVEDVNSKFLSGEFYKIMNVCYSLSYTREFGNANVKYYSRWLGSVPSNLNSLYWLEPPSTGCKTTVFRILDAASIFIGL